MRFIDEIAEEFIYEELSEYANENGYKFLFCENCESCEVCKDEDDIWVCTQCNAQVKPVEYF